MRPGEFVIRPYSVSELASLYRPEVQAGQARKWLWQAVACRTSLIETLQTLGYTKATECSPTHRWKRLSRASEALD